MIKIVLYGGSVNIVSENYGIISKMFRHLITSLLFIFIKVHFLK